MLTAASAVNAQQLPVRIYTTADGRAHDHVRRIVLDSRGFLWFCTMQGLNRFDGQRFIEYSVRDGLGSASVSDLLETREGDYWVATDVGVSRFARPHTFRKLEGRSGFNQAVFNNARAGSVPTANLPRWLRFSDEGVWPNFRIGPKAGQPYPDTQFPTTALDELSKQGVPDVTLGGRPAPNPTLKALSDLASQVNGAVVMGHSQSGSFPLAAALLNPAVAKGLVLVEPGTCPATYTDEQIATLAKLPILVVFGDYRDTPTGIPTLPTWQARYEGCQALIGRLKAVGGQAQMISPTEIGTRGNSHMIMQDRNHLQVADLILKWIDERVSKPGGIKK